MLDWLAADRSSRAPAARVDFHDASVYVVFLLILVLHVVFASMGADTDDALITYRYAERLAAGEGFTYNDGERVLGTTTPLWTLVLAAGAAAGTPPPILADILNPIFGALAGALLFVLVARAWGRAAAGLAAVLYASSPVLLRSAAYGMETPLFCLLVAATLYFLAGERWVAAGAVLGLACVTRLEGGLLGAAIVLVHLRHPRRLVRLVVPAAVVVVPWAGFATAYFGGPLPHSLQAKLVHGYRPGVLETARFLLWLSPHRLLVTLTGALGVYALAGGALSREGIVRRSRPAGERAALDALRVTALFAGAYVVFYLAGHPVPYEWYLPPLQAALIPLSGVAFAEASWVAARVVARWRESRGRWERARWPSLLARTERLAVILLVAVSASVLLPRTLSQAHIWRGRVAESFLPMVAWIDAHAPRDARVFAGDIGYLGYHTRRPIIDASALVSPGVLKVRKGGGHPNAVIAEVMPEVLVFPVQPGVFPVRWPDAETQAMYEPRARFPAGRPLTMTEEEARDWFRMQGGWKPDYVVYLRKDLS